MSLGGIMSKIQSYFMDRMETDPEFRRSVELAELLLFEPDFQADEENRLENPAPEDGGQPYLDAA